MIGKAYVQYLALFLRFEHAFVHVRAVTGLGHVRRIMELINVYVIGPQQAQGGMKVLPEGLRRGGAGLGGYHHLIAHALEGCAELFLAVGVISGGVKIVHAALTGPSEQPYGRGLVHPLHGQGAEGVFLRRYPGLSESYLSHIYLPYLMPAASPSSSSPSKTAAAAAAYSARSFAFFRRLEHFPSSLKRHIMYDHSSFIL